MENRGIPGTWELVPLKDLGQWSGGGTPSKAKPEYWEKGKIPWVSPKDMKTERIVDSEDHITKAAVEESTAKLISAGSVLIVTRSGILSHTLPVAVTTVPVTVNQDLKALTPKEGVLPEYVAWALRSFARDILNTCSKQGTTVNSIETAALHRFEIPVAPLDQQKHIVAEIEKQFSRLDEAVANLKRVKANLKRYKAAVLKAAVEGRLVETEAELARKEGRSYETGEQLLQRILETRRGQWKGKGKYKEPTAPDITNLPELPEGWVWANVDELAEVVRGASPRPAGDPKYFGGPIPWITVGPITAAEGAFLRAVPESVTELGKENSRYIEPGTLLLTNSGATLGVPKITLIGGCINDGVAALLEVEGPLKMYLLHHLSSLTESLRRINQGAAQPNLNTSIIRAILIPLPPSSEQDRIVTEIDRRLSLVREVESQIEANSLRSDRLRQSILAEAFSGRLLLKVTQERSQYVKSVAKGR